MQKIYKALASLGFASAVAFASSAQITLSDEERRSAAMRAISVEDDGDLRKQRKMCDEGRFERFRVELAAEGVPMPPSSVYCRAVLHEEFKRGRMNSYRHKADHTAISNAALSAEMDYLDRFGTEKALSCERAYDAGYQAGTLSRGSEFQETLRPQSTIHWQACFDKSGLHPALGFVAGFHNAQQDLDRD